MIEGKLQVVSSPNNSFKEAIRSQPLMFEPSLPPILYKDSSADKIAKVRSELDKFIALLKDSRRVNAINIPELIEENHSGKPYRRSLDAIGFASIVDGNLEKEIVANKIVAHFDSTSALEAWVKESLNLGIKNIVAVGGSYSFIRYPGPSVIEANRIITPLLDIHGGLLGSIVIPQRKGEAVRMLEKTKSGTSFFTTQMLFDSQNIINLIAEYDKLCKMESISPATILISFAPVTREEDLRFMLWLGAEIPQNLEQSTRGLKYSEINPIYLKNAINTWEKVLAATYKNNYSVHLGVNVEQILKHNLSSSLEMLDAFTGKMQKQD